MQPKHEKVRPSLPVRTMIAAIKWGRQARRKLWRRLPSGVQKFLFPIWLALCKLGDAARPWVQLRNRPKGARALAARSQEILENGRDALHILNSFVKEQDHGVEEPPFLTKEQLAAFIGVAATYLGVGAYVFGYSYYSTFYNRLLPGMNIDYSFSDVLGATYRQSALLILALVPALAIAARLFSPGAKHQRHCLRKGSRYAFLASAAGHEIRRHLREYPENTELLDPLHDELRELRNDIIKAMPDGYWMIATGLQVFRFRLIWTTLFCLALLALIVQALIWLAMHIQLWVYGNYAVQGWQYVLSALFLQFLLALLATAFAGAMCTLFFSIEAHYYVMPGKLLRRRLVLGLLGFAVLISAVLGLARNQAIVQRTYYKYRFTQIAIELDEPMTTADGRSILALPTTADDVGPNTIIGYSVPVAMSGDYFLLVPLEDPRSPQAAARLARVRIPADSVRSVTRNTGEYDSNVPPAAPDGNTLIQ